MLTELRDRETTAGAVDRMLAFDEFGELVELEAALRGRGALRVIERAHVAHLLGSLAPGGMHRSRRLGGLPLRIV